MTYNIYQQAPAGAPVTPPAQTARLDDDVISFATDLFSALAHPTRLRIVELLSASDRTVNEIAHELDILQPNTSQHLAILQRAGVVRVTPRGALRSYSICAPRMNQILLLVDELREGQVRDDQSTLRPGSISSHRLTLRSGNGKSNGHSGDGLSGSAARTLQARRDEIRTARSPGGNLHP